MCSGPQSSQRCPFAGHPHPFSPKLHINCKPLCANILITPHNQPRPLCPAPLPRRLPIANNTTCEYSHHPRDARQGASRRPADVNKKLGFSCCAARAMTAVARCGPEPSGPSRACDSCRLRTCCQPKPSIVNGPGFSLLETRPFLYQISLSYLS